MEKYYTNNKIWVCLQIVLHDCRLLTVRVSKLAILFRIFCPLYAYIYILPLESPWRNSSRAFGKAFYITLLHTYTSYIYLYTHTANPHHQLNVFFFFILLESMDPVCMYPKMYIAGLEKQSWIRSIGQSWQE